ncbi:MAG: hypothetical protein ONB44_00760 [candidate division KSB1 bacterium]|nr:hypothetical protein [candidate division KSB1 bacterium]MDZ7300649.1 hypothetical protein [candidate division KSB1 bacterium]MDZ7309786.1 hypothetical protein [candidate division KSB1 bacterium]
MRNDIQGGVFLTERMAHQPSTTRNDAKDGVFGQTLINLSHASGRATRCKYQISFWQILRQNAVAVMPCLKRIRRNDIFLIMRGQNRASVNSILHLYDKTMTITPAQFRKLSGMKKQTLLHQKWHAAQKAENKNEE